MGITTNGISGGGGGGGSILGLAAIKITLADNATYTYPNASVAGAGWVKYGDELANFDFKSDGTISNIVRSSGFGISLDNAGTVNIYKVGADIITQNKTGASIELIYWIEAV